MSTQTTRAPSAIVPAARAAGQPGDAGRARRLAEDALQLRDAAGPVEDLLVRRRHEAALRLARGARGLLAAHRRADADRRRDRLGPRDVDALQHRRRAGRLAAQHPRPVGRRRRAATASLKPAPVGRDVAGVADRQHSQSGTPISSTISQRRRLLALEPVRVEVVDERDRMRVAQLADEPQGIVEGAVDRAHRGAAQPAPGRACRARSCRPARPRRSGCRPAPRRPPPTPTCCRSTRR